MGRFFNADIYAATGQGFVGNNMFAYCLNNPVNMVDPCGTTPFLDVLDFGFIRGGWIVGDRQLNTIKKIKEDLDNFVKENTDIDKVYASNYFSSYSGTLVIRHSSNFLTSWASNGIIFLNHSSDNSSNRHNLLKHEYGHILHEKEIGTIKYSLTVFAPSAIFNLLSRNNKALSDNYYNMPWEYAADIRGGVRRNHAYGAATFYQDYFSIWELLLNG